VISYSNDVNPLKGEEERKWTWGAVRGNKNVYGFEVSIGRLVVLNIGLREGKAMGRETF
jgi:hypothetical protein